MAQLQIHTAQLEKVLRTQQADKIPADQPEFVKAVHHGILKAAVLNVLARKPAFANKEVDKDTLKQEINRLKGDPSLQALPKLIASGKGNLLLEGVKKLEGTPEDLNGFLTLAAKDPATAERLLRQQHPKAAPQYVSVPQLPKTQVVRDQLPSLKDVKTGGDSFNTPLGRYKHELNVLDATMAEWHGSSAQYKKELQKNLTKLYALRQIIAGTKAPDAVSQTLDEDLSLRVESLNVDPAFRNALRGMEINDQYTGRVVNTITKTGSFEQMNRQLQRDGEKLFRHEIKAHNKALELNPAGKDELNQERVPSPGV